MFFLFNAVSTAFSPSLFTILVQRENTTITRMHLSGAFLMPLIFWIKSRESPSHMILILSHVVVICDQYIPEK